jgi:hypothetical protein
MSYAVVAEVVVMIEGITLPKTMMHLVVAAVEVVETPTMTHLPAMAAMTVELVAMAAADMVMTVVTRLTLAPHLMATHQGVHPEAHQGEVADSVDVTVTVTVTEEAEGIMEAAAEKTDLSVKSSMMSFPIYVSV